MSKELQNMMWWLAAEFGGEISIKMPPELILNVTWNVVGLKIGEWRDALQVGELNRLSLCQAVSLLGEIYEIWEESTPQTSSIEPRTM